MPPPSDSIPARITPAARARRVSAYRPSKPPGPIDLWLDANEGPHDDARLAAILESIDADTVRRYPDASALERRIAESRGVDPARVLVTAGGDDAINRLCLALLEPGRAIVQHTPTFTMIEHSARLAGADVRSVPWTRGPFPLREMLDAVTDDVALVSVVSPNNPTGGIASLDDIRAMADRTAGAGALLMVDLAYAEFADADPTERLLDLENVVIIRTLSKAWSMAGLRVGYMIAPPEVVEWCRATGGPFPVSGVSLGVIGALLRRGARPDDSLIDRVRAERTALTDILAELGADPLDSQANFVLAEFPSPARARWIRDALAGLGIGVRAFSGPGLSSSLRITCPGDAAAFDRVCEGLRASVHPAAILFDLDGVLADVSRSYREAVRLTVESFGGTVTGPEIACAKLEGDANNDWVLSQRLLARQGIEVSLDEVTNRFESLYQGGEDDRGLWQTETLLTTRATLERIAERLPLAIVTGRPRRDAERFLEHAGIADLVSTSVCMEDGPPKPAPDIVRIVLERLGARRAWMVGDTVDDVRAARGTGVVPIAIVPPGDNPDETAGALLRAGAARVISSVDDLLELLQ